MRIKNIVREIYDKILYREKSSSKSYIKFLRKKGVRIGQNVTFHNPRTTVIDVTQPSLIEIGNNVEITNNVTILCHDYAWSVFKQLHGEIMGSNKKVVIGNNVFIGVNTVILRGISIGDNCVIGAGSIVTKDIPNNTVAVGNPAKVIMTIDEFYEKRKQSYINDAKELLIEYYKKNKSIPPKELFRDYFPIFMNEEENIKNNKTFSRILKLGGNKETTIKNIKKQKIYENYDEFIKDSLKDIYM